MSYTHADVIRHLDNKNPSEIEKATLSFIRQLQNLIELQERELLELRENHDY